MFHDLAVEMPNPNNPYGLIAYLGTLAFIAFVVWALFCD